MRYQAPVNLVFDDGTLVAADADLRVETDGGLKQWLGTATVDDPSRLRLADVRVQMMDAREGRAAITSITPSGEIELQGTGPAPWMTR